jgi:hypothetical protein
MLYTAQPLINRMIETQHDPKEYNRLRPFYSGLAPDWAIDESPRNGHADSPSRISRFISSVGTTLHIL